jgi:hypothetical protein
VQQSPTLPVGLTIDRGFALLRRHARPLLLPQLVLQIIPLVVAAVLVLIGLLLLGDVDTTRELTRRSTYLGDSELKLVDVPDFTDGQIATLIVLGVVGGVVYAWFLIASFISVVRAADRVLEGGEPLALKPAMRQALKETPKLFGIGLVFGIMAACVLFGAFFAIGISILIAGPVAIVATLATMLALTWLGVRVILWPFVHLSEGKGLESFLRSWRLTKGRFWASTGVVLLVGIVVGVVSLVVGVTLQVLLIGAASLGDQAGVLRFVPYIVFATLFGVVFTGVVVAPLAVAYRTLSGRDTADLWAAALRMAPGGGERPVGPPGPGGLAVATPRPATGVPRWSGFGAAPAGPAAPDASGLGRPGGSGPASDDGSAPGGERAGGGSPSDPDGARRSWGRDAGDDPATG